MRGVRAAPQRPIAARPNTNRSTLYVISGSSVSPASLQWCDRDRIEVGDTVGLGPQRHLPGIGKGSVLRREQRLAVKGDGEPVAFGLEREGMPLVRRDLEIGARQLLPAPFDDLIEAHIVFERVGAGDIVIIGRLQTHRDAARLIYLSSDRFEAHR